MNNKLISTLVCPSCKAVPMRRTTHETVKGTIKRGSLRCQPCKKDIATIRHGKVDFLRVAPDTQSTFLNRCDEFHYRRLPWNDSSVTAIHCNPANLGWNAEGFGGCLQAGDTRDWSICIDTDATDLSLRFLSHDKSGKVSVAVDHDPALIIDLYAENYNDVKAFEIFCNRSGKKKITIKQASRNPASNGDQVFFFGMDAVFSGELEFAGKNRGNRFPQAYKWVLDNLGLDALVLDCGSGDRKYPDPRVVSFEYMPFELPDVFGDGHSLPFADGVFDAVFSQAVMEHMRNPYLAAREIARITKPGGLIYVESAFMQPLHAVPYHFFNTTTWGIEAIFNDANVNVVTSEWFGPISASVDWYLNACGGGGLNRIERRLLRQLFLKVDSNVSYEQLKPMASGVAFWGVKAGAASPWNERLTTGGKPSFEYKLATSKEYYRLLKSAIKKIVRRYMPKQF